jgi:protein-tyrosine phosphatase
MPEPTRILMVCMGNICRSPTAEGVMRSLVREAGLEDEITIDSAGTGNWHAGDPPDRRATQAARARGVTLEGAARQLRASDFDDFDLLLAMDRDNLAGIRALAPDAQAAAKARLLREFDPASAGAPDLDVPDPYYGGPQGFETVLDQVEAACRGLLAELRG